MIQKLEINIFELFVYTTYYTASQLFAAVLSYGTQLIYLLRDLNYAVTTSTFMTRTGSIVHFFTFTIMAVQFFTHVTVHQK